ncbi:MAG: hypothetical protein WD354_07000 [Acidimicrobiia bacterium]
MDIAVNLVESYLRLNGYLTITEVDIPHLGADGRYESLTDVDVLAVRFPGDLYAIDIDDQPDSRLLLIDDPSLLLTDRMVDVIVGEVKQGPAKLNPSITRHEVLHHILGRLAWIYEKGVAATVEDLQSSGSSESPGRSGAVIRTRLVAFGGYRGAPSLNIIPLGHVLGQVVSFFERFEDVLRPGQVSAPAPALLHLFVKCGYTISVRRPDAP